MRFSEYGTSDVLRIVDLPGGLGSDVAGAADQVGEGVTAFSAGDEVLGASLIARGPRAIGTALRRPFCVSCEFSRDGRTVGVLPVGRDGLGGVLRPVGQALLEQPGQVVQVAPVRPAGMALGEKCRRPLV
ncbi:hypothetical protein ACWIID_40640 [Streptomyces phaeochromogenes]